jgi:hypothetical protein
MTDNFERSLKKGTYGERLLYKRLEADGFLNYTPRKEGSHFFDGIVIGKNRESFICEIKSYRTLTYYEATGVDFPQFLKYQEQSRRLGLRVKLFFIDEELGLIYGNYLDVLEQPVKEQGRQFPWTMKTLTGQKRVWPFSKMKIFYHLTEEEIKQLKAMTHRKYGESAIHKRMRKNSGLNNRQTAFQF